MVRVTGLEPAIFWFQLTTGHEQPRHNHVYRNERESPCEPSSCRSSKNLVAEAGALPLRYPANKNSWRLNFSPDRMPLGDGRTHLLNIKENEVAEFHIRDGPALLLLPEPAQTGPLVRRENCLQQSFRADQIWRRIIHMLCGRTVVMRMTTLGLFGICLSPRMISVFK